MLDKAEITLLRALENDARLPFAELVEKLGSSKTQYWSRVQQLEKRGVIKGYRAEIDPAAVGLHIHAFVQITVRLENRTDFEAEVDRYSSITRCFATTGEDDYLLEILVPDLGDLDRLVRAEISHLPGVERIVTTMCVRTIKHRTNIVDCML